jgi:hypothetical protein
MCSVRTAARWPSSPAATSIRALHLIVDTRTLTQTIGIANTFVGVAFSLAGNKIYVGGGASNDVKILSSAATARLPRPDPFQSRQLGRAAVR